MIPSPAYCLERSIVNYLQGCLTNTGSLLSGSTVSFYTGINNQDKVTAPFVVVSANQSGEVVPFSRCYEFQTQISVYEMAADTTALGVLSEAVFNEFVNNPSASINFSNPSLNINVWQVQTLGGNSGMDSMPEGDALVNTITCRIIGALVPNS